MADRSLLKSLGELVEQGFISAEQAERIRVHYTPNDAQRTDRSLLLFGVLGGLLIGIGVVLLVAHNWDGFPRGVRTLLALLPMLIAQALCLFALLKRPASRGWMEGTSLALSFMVAAAMSLVAQIYHIADDINAFFLTWAVLIIGLVYVMRSFATALLYIVLITVYAIGVRTDSGDPLPWLYPLLFMAILPFYRAHVHTHPRGVSTFWLAFFVAVSFAVGSQLFWRDFGPWQSLGTAAMAMLYALVPLRYPEGARVSAFRGIGVAGLLYLVYIAGSRWADWSDRQYHVGIGGDIVPLGVMLLLGLLAFIGTWRKRSWRTDPVPELFFVYAGLVLLGFALPELARLLANLALLVVGVLFVRQGIASGSIGRMNLGLLVLAAVIVSRFFDFESFIVKGVLAIAIGVVFLLLNLRMVRARKRRPDA